MVTATSQPDSELFCTPATAKPHMQPKPERHPSTLIPGGHTSPLRHPTILRPGAGQVHHKDHMRKSSENLRSQTPRPTGQQAPKPIYKAYSPATTPPDPRASVIASEIEGYFTALNVPPLQIKKQAEPSRSASPIPPSTGRESPVQRCASPPVPPKVKIEQEEEVQPRAAAELLQSPLPRTETPKEDDSAETECPPAYDESQRVPPPPEKARRPSRPVSSDDNLAVSAAASAARVGGSVAGVDTDEAVAQDVADDAAHTPGGDASQAENATEEEQPQAASGDGNRASSPPPLPPRTASGPEEIQPDTQAHMPGAFPPPPKRSPSPRSSPPQNGAAGAAASSATAIGAAVAMPSSDFAHGGLRQARNVLGKHMKHMVDRAKEHHEQHLAKKTTGSRAGIEEGSGRDILVIAPVA